MPLPLSPSLELLAVLPERADRWMCRALTLARRAAREGEVPVGALVLRDDEVLAEGWNRTVVLGDPTAHAEILALRRAAARTGNHRLEGAVLVTTLEPCVMCLGAALEARVAGIVSGAADPLRGAASLWKSGQLRRYPVAGLDWIEGVEEPGCRAVLEEYFQSRRDRATWNRGSEGRGGVGST